MLKYAEVQFRALHEKYANDVPIIFNTNKSKSRAAVCLTNPLEIQISEYFLETATKGKVVDVLLHELAHAIAGVDHMHDDVWKQVAVSIGCTADRCSGPFLMKKHYKHVLTCGDGCEIRKLRLTKKYLSRPHVCGPHKKLLRLDKK